MSTRTVIVLMDANVLCLFSFREVLGKVEKRSGALSTRITTPPAVPIIDHQPRDSAILSIQNVKRKKKNDMALLLSL